MLEKLKIFAKDVKKEMYAVSWPNKFDIKEGTSVVIAISAIIALFLFGVDTVFNALFRFLF